MLLPFATSHAIFRPTILDRLRVAWFCLRHGHKVCVGSEGQLLISKEMPA